MFSFVKKYMRIIITIAIIVGYFMIVLTYFNSNFFEPFWRAKANDYQTMPTYRLAKPDLSSTVEDFFDKIKIGEKVHSFESLHHNDYKIEKIEDIEFQEFLFKCQNTQSLRVNDIIESYSTLFIPILMTFNKERLEKNPWFYYEVEILSIDPRLDFSIGLIERPEPDNRMSADFVPEMLGRREMGLSSKVKLGHYMNSLGFYLRSGELMISGSVENEFDIQDILHKMKHPKRLFFENPSGDQSGSFENDDDFSGETIGIAYNSETGKKNFNFF